jgi:hypothetical protein
MTDHNPFLWATAERNGRAHSFDMINLTLELRDRLEALEVAENERRFREGCKLVDEATPEQIRTAVDPASTLVERLACMCADFASTAKAGQSALPLARAAIREVAAWLSTERHSPYTAAALEEEAER